MNDFVLERLSMRFPQGSPELMINRIKKDLKTKCQKPPPALGVNVRQSGNEIKGMIKNLKVGGKRIRRKYMMQKSAKALKKHKIEEEEEEKPMGH